MDKTSQMMKLLEQYEATCSNVANAASHRDIETRKELFNFYIKQKLQLVEAICALANS
jgi:hypothetical protein